MTRMMKSTAALPHRTKLILAFGAVYFVWGSTYLAIKFAIKTLPPFFMASSRFLIAGAVMYVWGLLQTKERPTSRQWAAAFVIGGLMLLVGNGCVVWSEQRVASGLAALLVAAVPIWMVLLDWLWRGGPKPGGKVAAGIVFGMTGLGMLVGPSDLFGSGRIDPFGAGALIAATLGWSVGSIYSRDADLPKSPVLATGMEMLGGGVLLMVLGFLAGDHARLNLQAVSLESVLSLAYLIVFGSIVAFSAYVWLLGATTSARVATYAYVNPVVAVFLGWGMGDEPLTPRTFVAVAVVLVGVVLITLKRDIPKTKGGTTSEP